VIVFGLVLAALVLLALLGERASSRMGHRARSVGPLVHCPQCAVRHPAGRIVVLGGVGHCPRGHAIAHPDPPHGRVSTVAIFALTAVVVGGALLLATGVIGVP